MKTVIDRPEISRPPTTATGNEESGRARRLLPSLHRVNECPRCGYPTLALKGRTLCCEARLSETSPDIKSKKRRSATRKEKVDQVKGGSEGALYGPLFEQGKDTA